MTNTHTNSICLKNVTLIDGTGRPPMNNVDIHIKDGRIDRITEPSSASEDSAQRFVIPV
jgi:N-acyl-D-aspartate/D-glutamate deacylase